jgi:hypothetical protein
LEGFFADAAAAADADADPPAVAPAAPAAPAAIGAADPDADAVTLVDAVGVFEGGAEVAPKPGAGETEAEGTPPGSSPRSRGLRQMITAMPHAVTSKSIAMNATSFCFAEGPRIRMTTVGVLARRGFSTGRSGMRIVICGPLRAGNGAGVNGCEAASGPELGCPATP